MSLEILNKLSASEIGLKKPVLTKAIVTAGKEIEVMQGWGQATAMESGVSKTVRENGDPSIYKAFIGDFMARNLLTGEEFRSGKLFLPGVAENLVAGALQGQGDDFKAVQIAFIVSIKPSDKYTYVWGARPVIEMKAEDPLVRLKALFSTAPQVEAAPEPPAPDPIAQAAKKLAEKKEKVK